MKINYVKKNINISDKQLEYITKKIDHLKKLARRVDDESSLVIVNIDKVKANFQNISIKVSIKVPSFILRTDVLANTVEEAIDICEEKLKNQIEKYKSKFNKNSVHKVTGIKDQVVDAEIENEFI